MFFGLEFETCILKRRACWTCNNDSDYGSDYDFDSEDNECDCYGDSKPPNLYLDKVKSMIPKHQAFVDSFDGVVIDHKEHILHLETQKYNRLFNREVTSYYWWPMFEEDGSVSCDDDFENKEIISPIMQMKSRKDLQDLKSFVDMFIHLELMDINRSQGIHVTVDIRGMPWKKLQRRIQDYSVMQVELYERTRNRGAMVKPTSLQSVINASNSAEFFNALSRFGKSNTLIYKKDAQALELRVLGMLKSKKDIIDNISAILKLFWHDNSDLPAIGRTGMDPFQEMLYKVALNEEPAVVDLIDRNPDLLSIENYKKSLKTFAYNERLYKYAMTLGKQIDQIELLNARLSAITMSENNGEARKKGKDTIADFKRLFPALKLPPRALFYIKEDISAEELDAYDIYFPKGEIFEWRHKMTDNAYTKLVSDPAIPTRWIYKDGYGGKYEALAVKAGRPSLDDYRAKNSMARSPSPQRGGGQKKDVFANWALAVAIRESSNAIEMRNRTMKPMQDVNLVEMYTLTCINDI